MIVALDVLNTSILLVSQAVVIIPSLDVRVFFILAL